MTFKAQIKITLFLFFLLTSNNLAFTQNTQSYFFENEFEVSLTLVNRWSMNFGVGSRSMLEERFDGERIFGYQHEHLELNHFTNYQTNESLLLSLGLRYRFKEIFNPIETNEIRIIEQIKFVPINSSLFHRLRLEQRFRKNTIHRLRYDISYWFPLDQNFSLTLGTEALYAISSQLKPEAEQRFSIDLEISALKDLELELGFEYRIENYSQDLEHEFFILTGMSLNLN